MKLYRTDGTLIIDKDLPTIKDLVEYCMSKNILLYKANLYKANLRGANLNRADLYRAKGIRVFTVGNSNRLCHTYIHKDEQLYQLGCFNGNYKETIEAIRKKYGIDSSYERIVTAYKGAIDVTN